MTEEKITSPVRYRVGGSWGVTVVACEDGNPDRLMGTMQTREDAALVVAALNADTGPTVAAVLAWAADELDAQAEAHGEGLIDYTDHLRCFTTQPQRASVVPWPDGLARPVMSRTED